MPTHGHKPPPQPRFSLADKAAAVGILLTEEFGVPFCFFNTEDGKEIRIDRDQAQPTPTASLSPEAVKQLARDGRGCVTAQEDGSYQVVLILREAERPTLVGEANLPALASGSAQVDELRRLRQWVRSVGERLCLSEKLALRCRELEEQLAQFKRAWEVVLGSSTFRQLRLHRDSETNRRGLLKAAQALLDVWALLWVPDQPASECLVEGQLNVAPTACRALAGLLSQHTDNEAGKPVLWNQEQSSRWSDRFPQVACLLGFPIFDQQRVGWLIALNKRAATCTADSVRESTTAPFRSSDVATITPFAALLELSFRGSRRQHDLKATLVAISLVQKTATDEHG